MRVDLAGWRIRRTDLNAPGLGAQGRGESLQEQAGGNDQRVDCGADDRVSGNVL